MAKISETIKSEESQTQDQPSYVLSIATPTITTAPVYSEDISEASYMLPPTSSTLNCGYSNLRQDTNKVGEKLTEKMDLDDLDNGQIVGSIEINIKPANDQQSLDVKTVAQSQEISTPDSKSTQVDDAIAANAMKISKRRAKLNKKSSKLDAKSKLEKSRQSARECRARKKLRYQYLEDLVNNREKAVVKLRKQLTTVSCC